MPVPSLEGSPVDPVGDGEDTPGGDGDGFVIGGGDEAEGRRREQEAAHARRVMGATTQGVLILSSDGVCEYANAAASRLLGWANEELVGHDVHALIHPGEPHPCVFERPFELAVTSQQRDAFKTSRGGLLPVDATASPDVTVVGVSSVVCLFSDASAALRQEIRLQEVLAAREEAVRGLAALSVRQRDFVSTVNHELRTPLTSIMGYLDLVLENEAVTGQVREHLEVVDRNAKRLLAQVEELLLASRLEAGKVTVALQPVSIEAVVRSSVAAVMPQAGEKSVTVEVAVDDAVGEVMGDPDQLERVLLNLLSNALKFTPEGGRVDVTVSPSGAWVQVQVSDTGMGVPAGEVAHLFDKFFRSSISRSAATPGTGLGLPIVKSLVEAHGGQVGVVSEEGVGTAIAFTLRAHVPDTGEA